MSQFKVSALMFDLDGTLLNTAPEIAYAANAMLTELGLPPLPYAQIKGYIGEGAQVLIQRCLAGALHDVPDQTLQATAQHLFFAHYANNVTDSLPFDGVQTGLEVLKQRNLKLACVTNKPEKFTRPLLEASGLADFFEIVVSGDTLPKKKPDPIQLHHICAEFDVMEMEAMLVGDSATDIAAAQAAGCFIVTVPYGYNQGKLIDESQVDAMIRDLTELPSILM
ncbi:phosphoglycolate phosphatase [Methylotenera sp. N17]|uniref:phosphoglycolate phosphatase n=1 Tax=Methylotenera sp. N17 TaxID=1502761 RepID=UPI000648B1AA|nr:phosphoglycolate phosphatase [Methylotenera sp. N17]